MHADPTPPRRIHPRLVLDVAVDNDGARRLYGRREAASPRVLFLPGTSVVRMVREL